ncbi:FAD-dependent oxidoreductase [Niabella beijingensis]|uniref:FAD-dependent oxidoreductase n=1 Tax=Niabella beijingensis TaxID=2872700 RepID=UPI001CBC3F1E|nr:FAD-dependent oxidoreductase [Niabella beijingensis]MBZ4192478.1 FAD-dependent oxidoreductase [Niabella beijingensis]
MKRKHFIKSFGVGAGALMTFNGLASGPVSSIPSPLRGSREISSDLVIAGSGMGACAAALAALRNGCSVTMTEETAWIGGQLTQQGVSCPDEHRWIESFGATKSYLELRKQIREFYNRFYPLSAPAKAAAFFNPGNGAVSKLCHEPRVALSVLNSLLLPYALAGKLNLLLRTKVVAADPDGDLVHFVKCRNLETGTEHVLKGSYFVDATELGDLLPLAGVEYVSGAESKSQTNELHAAAMADPANNQALTSCFVLEYRKGEDHRIDKPENYSFWRDFVPPLKPSWSGKLLSLYYSSPATLQPKKLGFDPTGKPTGGTLNLWNYRRIIDDRNFSEGFYKGNLSLINWPQNDYFLTNIIDVDQQAFDKGVKKAKELSRSLLYWLQTEVERPDGGQGWPGLLLRTDMLGTDDGMAQYPYIRESRRIKPVFRILEEHVGRENRKLVASGAAAARSAAFFDSVGIGYYHIDLHPCTGGTNYIDFDSLPFQIPLGALLPQRVRNLLAANKNIGTTHITNGCYRLHPVEWGIGEAAGMVIAFSLRKKTEPHAIRGNKKMLEEFQQYLEAQGVSLQWPEEIYK